MNLSIIIPVYNVENYLCRCLDSCLKQDADDYEIILINDGSFDHSLSIIQKYANTYPRIKYLSQENQGLSVARNSGLKIAKGEYVWFVDSDDWIEDNCLSDIFTYLKNVDMVQLQYRYAYDDPKCNHDVRLSINGIKSGREVLLLGGLPAPAQFTIYRREFLLHNNLCFVPGIYHEDSEFKPRAVYLAESVISIDKICYNYYQRSNGNIMSSFKKKNAVDLIHVMNNLYDFSQDKEEKYQRAFYSLMGMNMNTLLCGYWKLSQMDKGPIKRILENNQHLFRCMTYCNNMKYRIEGSLFCFNINIGLQLHRLLSIIF